ncbi:hypothetical protein [Butyrivibrio sp. MB2005]|uniref:hypothetical protein n=1 Tax=Butyrivibrio sp. MB2005 TaxID=1280678 RepID=UPI0006884A31|nr:hypothetical protein [Butyrivibrio sp. MB2005]
MKKIYMLINLIPLGLFYLWDCVLGIGISPVRPMIILGFLILDILLSESMKDYLLSGLILFASSVIGVIINTTCYYYTISSDFETPIVGAFIAIVYAIGLALFIGIGAIIVHFIKKKTVDEKEDDTELFF